MAAGEHAKTEHTEDAEGAAPAQAACMAVEATSRDEPRWPRGPEEGETLGRNRVPRLPAFNGPAQPEHPGRMPAS